MEALIYIVICGAIYFIPTIVAYRRDHHNFNSIFLTNLLLGWTAIGWIIAVIWSVSAVKE